jgi:hypothetical protein
MTLTREQIPDALREAERRIQQIVGADYGVHAWSRDAIQVYHGEDRRVSTTITTDHPSLDSDEPKRMRFNFAGAGTCDPTDPTDDATRTYMLTATLMAHAAEIKPIAEELAKATITTNN